MELENTIIKLKKKKSLDGLNSRLHQEEERIKEVEYRLLKIILSEEKKNKKINK